jgi:serine/threonine protein kinase
MAQKKVVEEGTLGKGTFGVVALAQTEDGAQYAMKIQGGKKTNNIDKHAIATEMQLLETIGELYAEGEREGSGKHYAFMKLKQGGELFKEIYVPVSEEKADALERTGKQAFEIDGVLLGQRDLSRKEQLLLAVKSAEVIKFLHSKNIVHRDIKPENFLARFGAGDKKDIIIVTPTDLGLSHQLQPNEESRAGVNPSGTDEYMAPEVNQRILSKTNDIYSLGIMFKIDFGMQDNFIASMSTYERDKRPDIDRCIHYLKEQLKAELIDEAARANQVQAPLIFSTCDVEAELNRLLADEVTLLKELEEYYEPGSKEANKIRESIDSIQNPTTVENIKATLTSGFTLMVNLVIDSDTRNEKFNAFKAKLADFGNKIKSFFSAQQDSKSENALSSSIGQLEASASRASSARRPSSQ